MKLKSLSVENFRCYKTRTTVPFDDMTTIVGRNDAGKSSLLDALDIFFNDKSPDKNDAAKGGNAKAVLISCTFTDFPAQLVLDETAPTSLSGESLLNAAGELEVSKIFNCSMEKPKLTSLRVRAVHPGAADAMDLLALKIDELKARAQKVGVDSGVRRLILLNFFRAKAEQAVKTKQAHSTIFAVEEPETSQHPHNQRMLMRVLQQLAIGDDQVIVTTHTPMLARAVPSKNLRFLAKVADGSRTIEVGGSDAVNQAIAQSLGVLPDHNIKAFVIVEGVIDIAFLKSLARAFRAYGENVPDLDGLELTGEVVFVPAGGADNLALHPLGRPEFHLYDRDAPSAAPAKHQAKIDAVNQRQGCNSISNSIVHQ